MPCSKQLKAGEVAEATATAQQHQLFAQRCSPTAGIKHVLHIQACRHKTKQQPTAAQPVTPAVWLVVWVSMTFGFLQALTSRSIVRSLIAPYFQAVFFGVTPTIEQEVQDVTEEQHHLIDWCPYSMSSRVAWILASHTLAGAAGRLFAAWLSAAYGRRSSIWLGAGMTLTGVVLQATAWHVAQLVIGCMLTGFGLGSMYQAVLLEDIEIAPTRHRGMFASLWQLGEKAGIAVASGLFTQPQVLNSENGWRLALSAAVWPALAILLVLPWLPETPNSLIQRGLLEQGKDSLRRIRGPWYSREALAAEANTIWKAAGYPLAETSRVKRVQWVTRQLQQLFSRDQQPVLMLVALLTVFAWLQDLVSKQLLGGVISLQYTVTLQVILSLLPALANAAGVLLVDRLGRNPLLLSGAIIGIVSSVAIVCVCALLGNTADSRIIIALHAVSLVGLAWAWPAWAALTSEHFSLASRSAGIAVVSSLGAVFQAIALGFEDDVACHLKWGIVLVKTACSVAILVLVWVLLPETKCVPLEQVSEVWHSHRIWKAWYNSREQQQQQQQSDPGLDAEADLMQAAPWMTDILDEPASSSDSIVAALQG